MNTKDIINNYLQEIQIKYYSNNIMTIYLENIYNGKANTELKMMKYNSSFIDLRLFAIATLVSQLLAGSSLINYISLIHIIL